MAGFYSSPSEHLAIKTLERSSTASSERQGALSKDKIIRRACHD